MDVLKDLYLQDALHAIASVLLVPVVVCLFTAILFALYNLGTLVVEATGERRRYRAIVPELIAQVETARYPDIRDIVEGSGLLRAQKDDLLELAAYLWLPEDGRTEVARRLLATEQDRWMRLVRRCEAVSKVAPMLGLMGTLIPLGPGLMALGGGDTATLSQSLLIAFDTTTAGLAAALVCFLVAHLRRRWYRDYLVSLEALMNAMLERARALHDEGYEFERAIYVYDDRGKAASKRSLGTDARPDPNPARNAGSSPGPNAMLSIAPSASREASATEVV